MRYESLRFSKKYLTVSSNGLYGREYNLVVPAKDAQGMLHLHWKVAIYPAAKHRVAADRYHQCVVNSNFAELVSPS